MSERCPCGAGRVYEACCGKFHSRQASAATAEQLMRSRFSAFALGNTAYLLATWDPRTAPSHLDLDADVTYQGLQILSTKRGGPFDDVGEVEFVAWLLVDGRASIQRERSLFTRIDRRWVYSTGILEENAR